MRFPILFALSLALAACSGGSGGAGNNVQADSRREVRIGPVQLMYDESRIAVAGVGLPLPPAFEQRIQGMKLVSPASQERIGTPQCGEGGGAGGNGAAAAPPAGAEGNQTSNICTAEDEPGIIITMINRPFAEFTAPLTGATPVTLIGQQGIAWEGGPAGERATYTFVPVRDQTFLMIRRTGEEGGPDQAAVDAALASLRIMAEEPAPTP